MQFFYSAYSCNIIPNMRNKMMTTFNTVGVYYENFQLGGKGMDKFHSNVDEVLEYMRRSEK